MTGRLDVREIADLRARADLPGLIGRKVKLHRAGRGYVARCPFHDERSPSFSLYRSADAGWRFKCHSASCGERGDALDWLMRGEGLAFRQAAAVLNGGELPDGGHVKPVDTKTLERHRRQAARAEARERDKAGALWRLSRQAGGTVVETYLREARALRALPEIPAVLRFADLPLWDTSGPKPREAWKGPAMVAILQDAQGHGMGVHLTFLEPDGAGKLDTRGRGLVDQSGAPLAVRKMRGAHMGGAIRLCPVPGKLLAAGEGIETGLSVVCATLDHGVPGIPAWAAASLGNLCGQAAVWAEGAPHPARPGKRLPATMPDMDAPGFPWRSDTTWHVDSALLLGDGDTSDLDFLKAKLERAARRAAAFGLTARMVTSRTGSDFNDLLMDKAKEAA